MAARWGEVTVGELMSPIGGDLVSGGEELVLKGISTDSREIPPGHLFLALRGDKFDGHDFIPQAIERGASCIILQQDLQEAIPRSKRDLAVVRVADTLKALGDLARWWRHQHRAQVAVITGSAGKTTTKEMAAGILGFGDLTLKNKGNFNNLVGLPLTLLMLEDGHRRAALEMGMNRPGEIARLTEIADPDLGLITNVARAHLEGVGDVKGVARAKVEMLEKLSSKAQVLLNGDDDLLMTAAAPFKREKITYGVRSGNDILAHNIMNLGRDGFSFDLKYRGDSIPVRIRIPGYQNVLNALAASAIALCMNVPVDHIQQGLDGFEGVKGRFELTTLPVGATLVDDTYNANPSSLKAAIDSLGDLVAQGGRVIVGLGEMMELGDETVSAHLEAGGMVAEMGAYYFAAIGEHAREMIQGAIGAGFSPERAVLVKSHEEMADLINDIIKEGDLVFLKGSRRAGLDRVAQSLKGEMNAV